MKHTKGPWKVNPENHTEVLANGTSEWNTIVASVGIGAPDSNLIAAAPEMLEALEAGLQQLNYARQAMGIKYPAIDQIEKAIAKAKGEINENNK